MIIKAILYSYKTKVTLKLVIYTLWSYELRNSEKVDLKSVQLTLLLQMETPCIESFGNASSVN